MLQDIQDMLLDNAICSPQFSPTKWTKNVPKWLICILSSEPICCRNERTGSLLHIVADPFAIHSPDNATTTQSKFKYSVSIEFNSNRSPIVVRYKWSLELLHSLNHPSSTINLELLPWSSLLLVVIRYSAGGLICIFFRGIVLAWYWLIFYYSRPPWSIFYRRIN